MGSLHDILIFIALLHLLELFRWYIRVALFATYFLVVVPSKRNYALYCWAKYNHFVRIQHLLVPWHNLSEASVCIKVLGNWHSWSWPWQWALRWGTTEGRGSWLILKKHCIARTSERKLTASSMSWQKVHCISRKLVSSSRSQNPSEDKNSKSAWTWWPGGAELSSPELNTTFTKCSIIRNTISSLMRGGGDDRNQNQKTDSPLYRSDRHGPYGPTVARGWRLYFPTNNKGTKRLWSKLKLVIRRSVLFVNR